MRRNLFSHNYLPHHQPPARPRNPGAKAVKIEEFERPAPTDCSAKDEAEKLIDSCGDALESEAYQKVGTGWAEYIMHTGVPVTSYCVWAKVVGTHIMRTHMSRKRTERNAGPKENNPASNTSFPMSRLYVLIGTFLLSSCAPHAHQPQQMLPKTLPRYAYFSCEYFSPWRSGSRLEIVKKDNVTRLQWNNPNCEGVAGFEHSFSAVVPAARGEIFWQELQRIDALTLKDFGERVIDGAEFSFEIQIDGTKNRFVVYHVGRRTTSKGAAAYRELFRSMRALESETWDNCAKEIEERLELLKRVS